MTGWLRASFGTLPVILMTALPAYAANQTNKAGAPHASTSAGTGEIIVTAQRRSERARDVPLSVAVITEDGLQARGIQNVDDYASRVAGLHTSRDSTQSSFNIRGIQASASADPTSATAGLYLDDYPLYDAWFRYSTPDLRVFDVQRIEVLRGPQGTLYGATSLSGSIRVITNKPDLTRFGAKAESTLSTTDGGGVSYKFNGVLNIPLSEEKLALRVVGYTGKDGGYIDNPVSGRRDTNEQRVYGGRLYLRAAPDAATNLLASIVYQHDAQDDQAASLFFPPANGSSTEWNGAVPARTRSDLLIGTFNADRNFGDGVLALTGIYAINRVRDTFDATPYVALFGGGTLPTVEYRPSNSHTKILEARYTSSIDRPVRFLLGAYYNSRFREFDQSADSPSLVPIWGTTRVYKSYANQRATEYAVFGEATYVLSPKFEATTGLRVFHNAYHFYGNISGLINSLQDPLMFQNTDVSNNQTSYIPRLSLSWKPVPKMNLCATASKGYRFGLTNYNSGSQGQVPLTYKSDTLWNYELGAKASLWDGLVTLDSAIYYIDWSNVQLPYRNDQNLIYTTNAGDARSYGLETELAFRPNAALELNAALSVGHSAITRGNPNVIRRGASSRGPALIGIMQGDRLPGSQAVNASGGIQYTISGFGAGDAYFRLDDIYVGQSNVDFTELGSLHAGDYNLVNVRIGYRTSHLELTAFANNLFNSHGIVSAIPNYDLVGTDAAIRVRPRTVGLSLRANLSP